MKAAALFAALLGAANLSPEATIARLAIAEPLWLALWGYLLIALADAVRAGVPPKKRR